MIPTNTQTYAFDAPDAIEKALSLLQNGRVIAGPTDTVYGLMCQYKNPATIEQIYEIKGRPPAKAIPVLLANQGQLPLVARTPVPALATTLMERFWPGPLTIILPAVPELPAILTAGQETIAIRIPAHPQLRLLINAAGPLATTSANLSTHPETHSAQEVLEQLGGRLPFLLDGEEQPQSQKDALASTIVDLSTNEPRILRAGPLEAQIQAVLRREA